MNKDQNNKEQDNEDYINEQNNEDYINEQNNEDYINEQINEDYINEDYINEQNNEDYINEQINEDYINEQDNENYIRKPDKVIKETLIDFDSNIQSDYDIELEKALKISIDAYFNLCKKSEDYETQIIEEYNKEMLNRQKLINPIIFEIERISKYDKSYTELYQLLEPILQLYIQQYLNYYECDFETYNQIFNKLSKIRLNKDKLELLKNIFILLNN